MEENTRPGLSPEQYRAAAELRAALRGFLRRTERVSRAHGLTPERYELLLVIKTEGDQPPGVTVTGLCQSLMLGQSAVTQLVRRVEDLGLVHRELSPRDARVRYLRLTPEGEQRLAGVVAELGPERDHLAAVTWSAPPRRASTARRRGKSTDTAHQ